MGEAAIPAATTLVPVATGPWVADRVEVGKRAHHMPRQVGAKSMMCFVCVVFIFVELE